MNLLLSNKKIFAQKTIFSELIISLLLLLPIVIYYYFHYYSNGDSLGTGFIQGDMISYMSNARQHFDEGGFNLFYNNPFYVDSTGPHIYFQLQTLFLSVVWHITQIDTGIVFVLFGFVSSFFSILISLRLFKSFLGWNTRAHKLTFLLFIYGGGLLIVGGFTYSFAQGHGFLQSALDCLMNLFHGGINYRYYKRLTVGQPGPSVFGIADADLEKTRQIGRAHV